MASAVANLLSEAASPRAEALYNPWGVTEGMTLKEYVPPDVLAMLHPVWHDFPPESPLYYYIFAVVYFVGGLLSVFGNILVLYIFMSYRALRTPSNITQH